VTTLSTDPASQYIRDLFAKEDKALQQAFAETRRQNLPNKSIRPDEGRFLQFLVRACGARRALEIGTLGGYSGIWIARGLLPGGHLITVEKEPRHAEIARQHFRAAGVEDQVEIRLGVASDVLQQLSAAEDFDFVFLDADKAGLVNYLAWTLEHLRIGGVIAAHNAFRNGSVLGLSEADEVTHHMEVFNQTVAAEKRLLSTIYPGGDGIVISVKIA